jgi:hypothetical protein
MNRIEQTHAVCTALGWHLDWPDGSSTMKVWFDQDGRRVELDDVTMYAWLTEQGYTATFTVTKDRWDLVCVPTDRTNYRFATSFYVGGRPSRYQVSDMLELAVLHVAKRLARTAAAEAGITPRSKGGRR